MTRSHPQRSTLHNEIHARPPEPMAPPLAISHVVMLADETERARSREHLAALLREHHLPLPDENSTHMRMNVGPLRVRWQMHTEFVSWSFSRPLTGEFDATHPPVAAAIVPQEWLAGLPGELLANVHLWVVAAQAGNGRSLARQLLNDEMIVGSRLANGQCEVYTDFAIHADGASRMLVATDVPVEDTPGALLSPRALGRAVQQLLEIETYRMAALLGLPVARAAAAMLANAESELALLASAIREAGRHEEPQLLDRLTRLAGQVESQYAATHSRFSASAAYFELVDQRIRETGETPVAGLQTIGEFIERRLSPARATCAWVARREDALSERVSRISNLLRTRVEIEQQEGTQALLSAMNKRMSLQLKLQATVEGLSVAAITYYVVGLVSYLAKGAHAAGWPFSADVTAAVAIPVVALGVWMSMRRLHAKVFAER